MRVLLISRCPPFPLHLGDRLIPYHVVRVLHGRGHTFDLIALYDRPEDPDQVGEYAQFFRSVRLIPEPRRTQIGYLRRLIGRFFPQTAESAWAGALWQAVEEALHTTPYEVIHLFGGIHVYELREALRGRPTLIVPYESYSLFLRRALESTTGIGRAAAWGRLQLARAYERRMFAGYGGVVVLTEPDAATLRGLNPRLPLHVIPNGVDLSLFTPADSAPAPEPALLFVGNYEYGPNVEAALWLAREIFPRVQAEIGGAQLWLVGNGPPAEVRALAGSAIAVTGRVPDVRPYYAQAAAFIAPLRTGAGIKNKVLEAAAMAKPLIVTPVAADGIGLVAGQHALYGQTAAELAAAAIRLLNDPAYGRALGAAARRLVESRFTWEGVADQYAALYAALTRPNS